MLRKIHLIDSNMKEPELLTHGNWQISYFVSRCPDKDHTEDSAGIYLIDNKSMVLAVADGFGGHKMGEVASKMAIQGLHTSLGKEKDTPLIEAITTSYENTNKTIRRKAKGAATTLVVCQIENNQIRFYNAGDSKGILIGPKGKNKLETLAHNPLEMGMASGLINGKEAYIKEINHFVSNYLGSKNLRIDMTDKKEFASEDKILLVSDGATDNCDIKKISGKDAHSFCEKIVEISLKTMGEKKGKKDDLSVIVLSFKAL